MTRAPLHACSQSNIWSTSTIRPSGKPHFIRSGVKRSEELFDQPSFDAPCLPRSNEPRLDKAPEIDCYPERQDLNVELVKIARDHGTRISLGTDAHHAWQLEFIDLGLATALRAKIPANRILNFMPIGELKAWVQYLPDGATPRT